MPSLCGEGKINRRRVDWMREEVLLVDRHIHVQSQRSIWRALLTLPFPREFSSCTSCLYLPENHTCEGAIVYSLLHQG
jgi:hypothetical protein